MLHSAESIFRQFVAEYLGEFESRKSHETVSLSCMAAHIPAYTMRRIWRNPKVLLDPDSDKNLSQIGTIFKIIGIVIIEWQNTSKRKKHISTVAKLLFNFVNSSWGYIWKQWESLWKVYATKFWSSNKNPGLKPEKNVGNRKRKEKIKISIAVPHDSNFWSRIIIEFVHRKVGSKPAPHQYDAAPQQW
jgi:hypothetical protein